MTNPYCESAAQARTETFIYDAYTNPISTITGSYPDARQHPVIMVAELTGGEIRPSTKWWSSTHAWPSASPCDS